PHDPATAARLDRGIHDSIVGEAAPGLEIDADAGLAAEHGNEVPGPRAPHRRDQLRQQPGGERLAAGVELEVRSQGHGSLYTAAPSTRRTVEPDRDRCNHKNETASRAE